MISNDGPLGAFPCVCARPFAINRKTLKCHSRVRRRSQQNRREPPRKSPTPKCQFAFVSCLLAALGKLGFRRHLGSDLQIGSGQPQLQRGMERLQLIASIALYDTFLRTKYHDFVYLGSILAEEDSERVTFSFEVTCHVSHFVTAYKELLGYFEANDDAATNDFDLNFRTVQPIPLTVQSQSHIGDDLLARTRSTSRLKSRLRE